MADLLRLLDVDRLVWFIREERFHTEAIRAAWLIAAERVLGGARLEESDGRSRHVDAGEAARITGLLEAASRFARRLTESYPERLAARVHAQEILGDPWCTAELQRAAMAAVRALAEAGESWLEALDPVEPVDLAERPVVVVLDGVAPDVWLEAARDLPLPATGWARLQAEPKTASSLQALFAMPVDALEDLADRGVPYASLLGNEEHGLAALAGSSLEADRPLVLRVALLDRAAHSGSMSLPGMRDALRHLLRTELEPLTALCRSEGRSLILTTDHGLSLTAAGLRHGQGGIYERAVFRVRWNDR
jgi:hypothetical protein